MSLRKKAFLLKAFLQRKIFFVKISISELLYFYSIKLKLSILLVYIYFSIYNDLLSIFELELKPSKRIAFEHYYAQLTYSILNGKVNMSAIMVFAANYFSLNTYIV